jgi:ankyrin repeat protein
MAGVNQDRATFSGRIEGDITPLSCTALNGDIAVVRLLLEHKAVVGAKEDNGLTALHLAAENVHEGVVQLLKSKT